MSYLLLCDVCGCTWASELEVRAIISSFSYNLSGFLVDRGSTRHPSLHYLPCAMAKSDTWPGGVAMESLSNMDSAESCDSVISLNSGSVSSPLGLHISCPWAVCINTNVWHSKLTLRLIENKGKERTEGGVLPPVCTQTTTLAFITSWRQSWEIFCHSRRVKTAWSTSLLKSERVSCIWRKPSKLWRCRRTADCPTMNLSLWARRERLMKPGSEVGSCSALQKLQILV